MMFWRAWLKKPALGPVLAMVLSMAMPFASCAAEPWLVELSSFDAVQSRQAQIGKSLGNALLPMLFVSLAQQRIVGMYGKMRAADPIRWVGYSDGKGSADVVMVYPTIDKVAKMVLNHPGAEKLSADTVRLPADEGRAMVTYAVFSADFDWCAFASSPELARRALSEKYPHAGKDLFAISSGGVSGAFDFDEKGFKFTARTATAETGRRLRSIPLLGAFAQSGTTHYVKFDDVKKLVASLFKEMAAAKAF